MNSLSSALLFAIFTVTAALASELEMASEPSLSGIIERNIAARGGLDVWRKVETMAWVGHIETPNSPAKMHFEIDLKRPNQTRFEVAARNQLTLRVFDGKEGWKIHPASSGKTDLQPFSAEELRFSQDSQGIDGPLMDFVAKGVSVTLDGSDVVKGREAYRLNIKLASGDNESIWVDAQDFLEVKTVRSSTNAAGQKLTSTVFYGDYQSVQGLQLPFIIESGADAVREPNKMVIEQAIINPPLDEHAFAKPRLTGHRGGVAVDTRYAEPRRSISLANMSLGQPLPLQPSGRVTP